MGAEPSQIRTAEVLLPCAQLDPALAFFTRTLGFRVDAIWPADRPATAVLSGHGLRLRLQQGADGSPGQLLLRCSDPDAVAGGARELTAPNGTRITLLADDRTPTLPAMRAAFCLTRGGDAAVWTTGRAAMQYRDLIPDRQGGRFIASHIRIAETGPVPDYVHYHRVRFQMIYCHRGWTRLVYEDQGPPFVLAAGDCVLQPPTIRHRVLESGDGLEVIELACPAEHETLADHDLQLPNDRLRPGRSFEGQRFVHHRAGGAAWRPWRSEGFECRDSGIAGATDGLAQVVVVRPRDFVAPDRDCTHDAEFVFCFVLEGQLDLVRGATRHTVRAGDCFTLPAGERYRLTEPSPGLELLEVTLPAHFETAGNSIS